MAAIQSTSIWIIVRHSLSDIYFKFVFGASGLLECVISARAVSGHMVAKPICDRLCLWRLLICKSFIRILINIYDGRVLCTPRFRKRDIQSPHTRNTNLRTFYAWIIIFRQWPENVHARTHVTWHLYGGIEQSQHRQHKESCQMHMLHIQDVRETGWTIKERKRERERASARCHFTVVNVQSNRLWLLLTSVRIRGSYKYTVLFLLSCKCQHNVWPPPQRTLLFPLSIAYVKRNNYHFEHRLLTSGRIGWLPICAIIWLTARRYCAGRLPLKLRAETGTHTHHWKSSLISHHLEFSNKKIYVLCPELMTRIGPVPNCSIYSASGICCTCILFGISNTLKIRIEFSTMTTTIPRVQIIVWHIYRSTRSLQAN